MSIKSIVTLFAKPKVQIIGFLTVLWAFGVYTQSGADALSASLQVLLAVAIAVFAQWAFWDKKSKISPQSAIITGLLIGMLIAPGTDFKILWLTAVTAIASKFLFKLPSGKHIFNPAAAGIIVATVFLGNKVNWWGFSNPYLVIIIGGMILYRLKRLSMVFSYLIFRALSAYIVDGNISSVQTLLLPNLFFAFIMLVEPKTSPGSRSIQWIFGGMCGALSSLSFMLIPNVDGDLAALLVVNLIRPVLEKLRNNNFQNNNSLSQASLMGK